MTDNPVVIIPARYDSTRLPGKALADLGGAPMIVRVYEQACRIPDVAQVLVATDDPRIAAAIEQAGGRAVMTRRDHTSGTDRIAEAARVLEADIIVNVQGDLPCLEPAMIVPMVERLRADPELPMATVMTPARDAGECEDPNVVKVVTDRGGNALYFSRQCIPSGGRPAATPPGTPGEAPCVMRHIGLYAYRRSFLATFTALAPTPLERAERLEQLRALEHGYRIGVVCWRGAAVVEVNTPADLEYARAVIRGSGVPASSGH
jgi:3-deoxy-manno-octulosonate cytidylyltransferase (CMP-KDO synthetase)